MIIDIISLWFDYIKKELIKWRLKLDKPSQTEAFEKSTSLGRNAFVNDMKSLQVTPQVVRFGYMFVTTGIRGGFQTPFLRLSLVHGSFKEKSIWSILKTPDKHVNNVKNVKEWLLRLLQI